MTQPRVGIDTSVLLRLVTTEPPDLYEYCLKRLNELAQEGIRVIVSNQVIGEAYVTAHLYYGMSRERVRARLVELLTGGVVEPQNGQPVLDALNVTTGGPGLFDRLIVDGYAQSGMDTLTLDQAMARLPNARPL